MQLNAVRESKSRAAADSSFHRTSPECSLITANNTYLTALNNLQSAEVAFSAAQDRYGQVLLPSATDVAAQRSTVEAARAALDNRKLPYTDADIAGARATVANGWVCAPGLASLPVGLTRNSAADRVPQKNE